MAKPPEAEGNFKTKRATLRSAFHYLAFWCFQIFCPLLLRPTCYILCCQCKNTGGKANLSESCFGDWIIRVWGLFVAC